MSIATTTDPNTVMAEISQHGVDNTESTTASAIVDEHSAAHPQTTLDEPQTTQNTDEHVSHSNGTASSTLEGADAVDAVAEPSAGDVTRAADSESTHPTNTTQDTPVPSDVVVNGDSGHDGFRDGVVDHGSAGDGSVDVSVTSDNEGSRGDGTETKKDDGKHHTRTNSVKKPTTFSKVNVSKSYLAKSTAVPTVAKMGDKPTPAGTPPAVLTARPRLIAKTGASVMPKARLGSDAAAGPDANKVWNKNRRKSYRLSLAIFIVLT